MADNRKYYYLKLKESFFDGDSIVLLESMPDGILFSNILMKLYLKSLKNGGKLQLDEHIPYTAQILPNINQRITDKAGEKFIDENLYKQGVVNSLSKEDMKVSPDSAMSAVQKQMEFYHNRLMEQKYGKNREEGEKFLAENAKKEGVKTLPGSTVQYKVLKEGTGEKPKETSKVKVNYEGKLIDGTVFDSSYKRNKPATFECNRVIQGWTQALTNMPVGSTWEIYIPQELGYGAQETGGKIPPYSTLIFKVELLSIEE